MRVLVTGGLGFIGSHIVEHLRFSNPTWEIVSLDNFSYSTKANWVHRDENTWYVFHDIRASLEPVENLLGDEFDFIIHNAAQSHVTNSMKDPIGFFQTNVIGTLNVLEFARKQKNLKRFHYISTDEVYGPCEQGECHTEKDPHRPSNPYSASKAAGDDACYCYSQSYDVPMTITRTMNNYGERQHVEKFIPMTVKKVLNHEINIIHGSEESIGSRTWLHARNHADAVLHLLRMHESLGDYDVFNIAGQVELNNLEIVRSIGDILEEPVDFHFVENPHDRPGHDHRYNLSGNKLYLCGWLPPLSFEESFETTIRWFAQNRESL